MDEDEERTTGAGGARPGADILALLADRDFLRVWSAGAVLGIARWLETLAVGIFVVDLTGSAAAVAVVAFTRMLPLVLLGAVAGTLAGRFERRKLLVAGAGVAGLVAALLGGLAHAGAIAVWQTALGAFVIGALWTADFPVRRTIVADIAGTARIGAAMGLESATNHVTRLLGGGLGGLVVGAVGLDGAYWLAAALYAVVLVLLAGLRRADAPPAPGFHRNLLADTVGGLRVVAADRFLLAALAVTVIFNFFGFAYTAMVPVIGRVTLQVDAFAIGLLVAIEAAVSLVASLLLAALMPRRRLGALYTFSVFAFTLGVLAFALSPGYGFSLAVIVLTGTAWGAFSVSQSTLILLAAPPALRARAMGALAICIGLAPFGMLLMGWLGEHLGAPAAVALFAATGAAAVVAVALCFPRLVKPGLPGGA